MRRTAKCILTIISIACMFLLLGMAGGSDVGTITVKQALWGGMIALVGCIGCAIGAEAIHE